MCQHGLEANQGIRMGALDTNDEIPRRISISQPHSAHDDFPMRLFCNRPAEPCGARTVCVGGHETIERA
jgi:hypothetical protein